MAIESVPVMMAKAREGNYAVGYFESWNLESLQGVLDAAEQVRAPIIIGFNGEFLAGPDRLARERLAIYAGMGRAAAEAATVRCGFIFNECPNDGWVMEAATRGFNLVMPADHNATHQDYTRRVKQIVAFAHERSVAVEAELDELPSGATGQILRHETLVTAAANGHTAVATATTAPQTAQAMTDPKVAADFVAQTNIDLLAVSVGNVHIMVKGEQALDLDRLEAIRRRITIPLVLHGGTGITADSLRQAIRLGVTKVNYGTYLKQRYLAAVRASLAVNQVNPHQMLGIGGDEDVMVAGRLAVKDAVLERIGLLGGNGRS